MPIVDQHASPGIRKTMDYIRGPGDDNIPDRAKLIGGQGFGFDPKTNDDVDLAVDMMEHNAKREMQASQTKKCEKDALHISVSWPPGSRADQDEMYEAGKALLKELGMEKAMAVIYKHSDKNHPHMHMGVSAIDPKTGLTYDRYQAVYRGQHQAIKWEREKDQITPTRRHQHDVADAAGGVPDFGRLQKLLQKDEEKISHKKIDQALAYGGHFGRDMAAHREAFKKYIKDGPERAKEQHVKLEHQGPQPGPGQSAPNPVPEPVDRWWQEPVEPGQPKKTPEPTPGRTTVQDDRKLLRDGLKAADDAKDIDRRNFVERLERSHKQFGGLTPYMRTALGGDENRGQHRPEPTPKQPEPRVTISQAPREPDVAPNRAPGTGNTPDRTDQTAEGRAHIKRQKSQGRER